MKNPRLIIIDSDKINLEILSMAFQFYISRKIITFISADEAWAFIRCSWKYDIIISEVNMPGKLSGLDLCRMIKNATPEKLFVVMSDNPKHEQKARKFNADAFLAKPIKRNPIERLISTFIAAS